jgi:microcystin-dependent protein
MTIIGEIRAFAFDGRSNAFIKICKAGWIPCDGRALAYKGWPELGEAIGTTWGSKDPGVNFCVPNFFGSFLRGASNWGNVTSYDPEVNKRTPPRPELAIPGNSRMYVGSFQEDEFKSHHHTENAPTRTSGLGAGGSPAFYGTPKVVNTGESGGKETRPVNHYVLYMVYGGKVLTEQEAKEMVKFDTEQ